MKHADHTILGVHIHNRVERAGDVQVILTEFGHHIKTRLGLHEVQDEFSSGNGLLIIEMIGEASVAESLVQKLNACDGVETKKMVFEHD